MTIDDSARKLLKRLKTGKEVLDIVHASPGCRYGNDPLQNGPEAETVEEFFGLISDYRALCSGKSSDNCVEVAVTLTMLIQTLESLGFWVIGAPGAPAATIQVKRQTNEDIIMIRI